MELAIELELVDNSQSVVDSENEKIKKKFEYAVKRKAWRNNLHTPIQAFAAGFAFSLLSYLGSIILFLSCLIPALLSCLRLFILLLSCLVPTLLSCFGLLTLLSSYFKPSLLFYFISTLMFCLVSTLLTCFMPASFSHFMPALLSFVYILTVKSPLLVSISYSGTSITILSCLILGLAPTHLTFVALIIFKPNFVWWVFAPPFN